MKLEPRNSSNEKTGRFFTALEPWLEVSVARGGDIIKEGDVEIYGDGDRIVAVDLDYIHQHVADVVAACR